MDRPVSSPTHSVVTGLDIYGVAVRAVYNAINKEEEKGLVPRILVLDGLAALTAAYVARNRNLDSGFLLLDHPLPVELAPVELRCKDSRNEADLDRDMTTPEQYIARRHILEGEDRTPTWLRRGHQRSGSGRSGQ